MYGNLHSLANLYSFGGRRRWHFLSKKPMCMRREHLTRRRFLIRLAHPAPDDAFVFYKKRGSIDDPFFYSRLAGDNLHTGGVVDQLSLVRETVGYTPWYFSMLPTMRQSIRYCMEAVR